MTYLYSGVAPRPGRAQQPSRISRDVYITKTNQQGYTLIEMMVSLLLSSILLSIAYSLLLTLHSAYQLQTDVSELQHQANVVTHTLRNDIQLAGYIGCPRLSDELIPSRLNDSSQPNLDDFQDHQSFSRIVGSDQDIRIKHMSLKSATLLHQENNELQVDLALRFKTGQTILISDCDAFEIALITHVSRDKKNQWVTLGAPLAHHYHPGAEVGHNEENHYYLSKANHEGLMSLVRDQVGNHQSTLVKQLTDMRLTYLLRINGELIRQRAASITDWRNVIGVMIDFTVRIHQIEKSWQVYILLPT